MQPDTNIVERMARIRATFEDGLRAADSESEDSKLVKYLDTTDAQFRSVAYEGAAMSRALLDISLGTGLHHWLRFGQITRHHSVQVHIGLGWAFSQQLSPLTLIHDLPPIAQARVLDGYGYYDGMFRSRASIRTKTIPEVISGNNLRAYDQGLGRSLWYSAKGNLALLIKSLEGFADSRMPDLWRGIGIAISYVGGCDTDLLKSVLDHAGSYRVFLASGAVLLARARAHADTPDVGAELACSVWCHMTTVEAVMLMDESEPKDTSKENAYFVWLDSIENEIRKSVIQ
jgi:hypothetical protein